MRFEKEHRILENIDEIRIFNAGKKDFYTPVLQEFDVGDVPIQELINNISTEVHTLIPYDNGKDFIVQGIGNFTLERYNLTQDDVRGRLLSKISPLFFEIMYEYLSEVYTTHNAMNLRVAYYGGNNITKLNSIRIVFDLERIFVLSKNIDITINERNEESFDEDKTDILENFSQTGSYYNINGKYTWSQGIYNIINRTKEESDDYYNIVFDLVIPEDKHIVDKIFATVNKETSQCEEIIHIRTPNGIQKVVEVNVYSYFDESGMIIRQGLINDITKYRQNEPSKPVDFLMDGFKNSDKLALLIEPLNIKQHNFSKGFYNIIGKDYREYEHSRNVLKDIADKDVADKLNKLAEGELSSFEETFSYYAGGNLNNKKIIDLYIECFKYGGEVHSIGFLTDITDEMDKQEELMESYNLQSILIKETHHRVRNNLQIIISFLNLEKRAYRDKPELIVEHMQTRLNLLALLHEKTHSAEDFRDINLKDYLSDYDEKTAELCDLPVDIHFETDVDEDLNVSMEVITPFLLIVDELTRIILNQKSPDGTLSNKNIINELTKLDNDTARLIITEENEGIIDSRGDGDNLGWIIIENLTKQLSGDFRFIEYENVTACELIFPIRMEHTIH